MDIEVVIVGAGASGLATSSCLNLLSIPNLILEREDCCASLWKKRAYDRLILQLAKNISQLPHMPHPHTTPTYISRDLFIQYLDDYASKFHITPNYCRSVLSATYDEVAEKWRIAAKNTATGCDEEYTARFLIVASGVYSEGIIPKIKGLESFNGDFIHSSEYKSGSEYNGKGVLVVGCGNSGMEIALDLCNCGAKTSIVIRGPFHIISREFVHLGLRLLKVLPIYLMDVLAFLYSRFKYGNLVKYGISRPSQGPFSLHKKNGKVPILDVGTVNKIKSGEIKVFPAITRIKGNEVEFENGELHYFDAIIFATGYRSTTRDWVKDGEGLFDKDGLAKLETPNYWKGSKGLYCVGLSKRGIPSIAMDAQKVANDINMIYSINREKDHQT